jgi:aspartate kinase
MRAPVVQKFGGAGLADGQRVRRACRMVREHGGERAIVVVSAIGEVTALLGEALAQAARGSPDCTRVRLRHKRLLAELALEPGLCNRHLTELETLLAAVASRKAATAAERDHALSFGERLSARIVAAVLRAEGVSATPVDAWDLGLLSDSNHGRARPLTSALDRVGRSLASVPGVPVVTGFVAADSAGRLTTLGRSGSDLSAALIAVAAGARELQLWKTVGGVMSADPRLVPRAHTLRELSWSQAGALSFHGAGVLHAGALEPLERARLPARVLDLDRPDDAGTLIGARGAERGAIGIACRRDLALARGLPDGFALEAALEPLAVARETDGTVLIAADNEAFARFEDRLPRGVHVERQTAALALVAARPGELAASEGTSALRRAGLEPRLAWLDGPRAAAIWAVHASELGAAASVLHELVSATSTLALPTRP